jgi:enhancer of mRNA-decapping protein 3
MQDSMEKLGISVERRSESIARAVAEVALHFVGGPHRLTPKNSHQKPVVVVLCGNLLKLLVLFVPPVIWPL